MEKSILTYEGKLLTGVSFVVKELTGKEQRLMTEQGDKKQGDSFLEMMESIVISIGSVQNPKKDFIKKLLSGDRKKILLEARKFSLIGTDQENKFTFNYKYTNSKKTKEEHEFVVDLSNGCPETPYPIFDPKTGEVQKDETGKPLPVVCTEYDQVQKDVTITLPRSKKQVIFTLLDGFGEDIATLSKKKDKSSHTTLQMRNPRELYKKESSSEAIPIQLHLDSLSLVDIEYLRKAIKNVEGEVDTIVEFEHPEAEIKIGSEKTVRIDLVSQPAFFFPSGAI